MAMTRAPDSPTADPTHVGEPPDDILREVGLNEADIARLKQAGVVQAADD